MAQDQHRGSARRVVASHEGAAVQRLHAQHVEVVRRHHASREPFGFLAPEQVEEHVVEFDDAVQRARLPVVIHLLRREADVVGDRVSLAVVQDDELVAVLVGQRPQQHAVDDAEDRRVGADAERHRHDDDESEARIAAEAAQAVADVLRGDFDEPRQPVVAHVVLDAVNRAEDPLRLAPGGVGRHAFREVLLDQHVDVVAQLCIELTLETFAPE